MGFIAGPRVISATGGTISTFSGAIVHTFTTVGLNTFTPRGSGVVEVLVVGGGGGGTEDGFGNAVSGGGGGSVLYQKFAPVISGVAYTMNIGSRGGAVSGSAKQTHA